METDSPVPVIPHRYDPALRKAFVRLLVVLVVLICIAGTVARRRDHAARTTMATPVSGAPAPAPSEAQRCRNNVLRPVDVGRWPEPRRTDARSQLRGAPDVPPAGE